MLFSILLGFKVISIQMILLYDKLNTVCLTSLYHVFLYINWGLFPLLSDMIYKAFDFWIYFTENLQPQKIDKIKFFIFSHKDVH